jgi:hypothetical protein
VAAIGRGEKGGVTAQDESQIDEFVIERVMAMEAAR